MHAGGGHQLDSMQWIPGYGGDRPMFEGVIAGAFFGSKQYYFFALPEALLFLPSVKLRIGAGSGPDAFVAGWKMGGLIGGVVGATIAGALADPAIDDTAYECLSETQLFELARSRRGSFACLNDDIEWIQLDAPSGLARLLGSSRLAGWLTLRDRRLGKRTVEIYDPAMLALACESLPERFGDRVRIKVEYDDQAMRYRPRR
jgi:hypothetical protein